MFQCSLRKGVGEKQRNLKYSDIDAADLFSFRICDAALERRFYVWLPVPEWLQSCADPAMHRDSQEVASDHGYGRVQPGEELDPGGRSEGSAWGEVGLHLLLLVFSDLHSMF